MGEWKSFQVGEIGKVITGKTPKTSISDNYGGYIPFLTPSDDMSVKYVRKTAKTLTEKGLSEVKNAILPANSVCVSCIGSDLGKVVITTRPTVTNQQINSIVVDEARFDISFVYYAMRILGKKLNFISKTSTAVPIVNKSSFSSYEIECPSLKEQKQIAAVLSVLDAKIECNRMINNNLQQQAQAIFKSWFVDFEPFGGVIPNDWKQTKLGDSCNCILGGTPSRNKSEYWNGSIPWINSGEVNKFRIIKPSETITNLGLEKSATKLLPAKTTVLAITGATLGQVSLLEIDACANQSVVGIIPNDNLPYEYIYPLIKQNIAELISHQTGGAQQHINKQNVENLDIVIPAYTHLMKYQNTVCGIYEMIANNCFENDRLSSVRDTLLPKLMSSELDVSDIDL